MVTGTPNGTRTRVSAVKGRRPRPLDDGSLCPLQPCNRGVIISFLGQVNIKINRMVYIFMNIALFFCLTGIMALFSVIKQGY